MSKFVIECPSCGNYAEARSGFLGIGKTRMIHCSCGHVINVQTEKFTSRKCHHCGNSVVFDQSQGDKAKCPVCGEAINTLAEQGKLVEFSCEQCGIRLQSGKNAELFTCPVCDHVNDIAERLQIEKVKQDGLASDIKYEGDNQTLIWKHPIVDFNMGSQLIVHESQEAIFFRDGQALDRFKAGRYTLETQQLPILDQYYKLPTDTQATFHSEVYFINMVTQMAIKWGTPEKIGVFDPASGIYVDLGAGGEFSIRVIDSRKLLLKLVGTTKTFTQEHLLKYFKSIILTLVKSYLAEVIEERELKVLKLNRYLMVLSQELTKKINELLVEYGLEMPEFWVERIVYPENEQFNKIKNLYGAITVVEKETEIEIAKARAEAKKKMIEAETKADILRTEKAAEADAYRMQARAEADEMKMKGYSYQQETERQVSKEAMKNGIPSGGTSGVVGDIANIGIVAGVTGRVAEMTKEAISPSKDSSCREKEMISDMWECSCGMKNLTSKCCPECGAKRPEKELWDCKCGMKNLTSKCCPECGAKRPEKQVWDCKCGMKNLTSKCCPECGAKRPEKELWDCKCGMKNLTSKCCPECGAKRPEKQVWDCECGMKNITTKCCPECGSKRGE